MICVAFVTPMKKKIKVSSSSTFQLSSIALPAEQEGEQKKKRDSNDVEGDGDGDGSDKNNDWTETKGGFIPNIFKKRISRTNKPNQRSNFHFVDNIHDYKTIVADEKEQIVVVRFFASWCRSCKASKPQFNKVVTQFVPSNVKFVELPLTKETQYLHEGLGVPSVPFVHIYHPEAGLVEEMKMSKPHFAKFVNTLKTYVDGSCDIVNDDNDDDEVMGTFE